MVLAVDTRAAQGWTLSLRCGASTWPGSRAALHCRRPRPAAWRPPREPRGKQESPVPFPPQLGPPGAQPARA